MVLLWFDKLQMTPKKKTRKSILGGGIRNGSHTKYVDKHEQKNSWPDHVVILEKIGQYGEWSRNLTKTITWISSQILKVNTWAKRGSWPMTHETLFKQKFCIQLCWPDLGRVIWQIQAGHPRNMVIQQVQVERQRWSSNIYRLYTKYRHDTKIRQMY